MIVVVVVVVVFVVVVFVVVLFKPMLQPLFRFVHPNYHVKDYPAICFIIISKRKEIRTNCVLYNLHATFVFLAANSYGEYTAGSSMKTLNCFSNAKSAGKVLSFFGGVVVVVSVVIVVIVDFELSLLLLLPFVFHHCCCYCC